MLVERCKYSWSEIDTLKDEWKSFADKHAGEFRTFVTKTDLLRFENSIPFSDGQIRFVTTEFKPLKIHYSFKKGLVDEFLIYYEDFSDKIMKFLGSKEIHVDDPAFDNKFFIETNNEMLVRQMLTLKVRDFLLHHKIMNFKLERNNDEYQLCLTLVTNELEISNLETILAIFKDCILTIESKK